MQLIKNIMWIILFGIGLSVIRKLFSDSDYIVIVILVGMFMMFEELKTIIAEREGKQDDTGANRESK